jgi:hypothetical protein
VGWVAFEPKGPDAMAAHKLYLRAAVRGGGVGMALMAGGLSGLPPTVARVEWAVLADNPAMLGAMDRLMAACPQPVGLLVEAACTFR